MDRQQFQQDKAKLLKQSEQFNIKDFPITKEYPILNEDKGNSGTIDGQYFYQDLLVAQKIFKNNPTKHVDIGSRLDGFITHVASFREIEVFDIRPIGIQMKNIIFKKVDFMKDNPHLHAYCDSISSLHVIEHFGLGRYGDEVDINGHLKGLGNIYKMLKKNGKFYFSVPIGKQRIEFNAHRVFSVRYLLNQFKGKYKIDSFSYANNKLIENAELTDQNIDNNFSCHYGCGIFEMTKL